MSMNIYVEEKIIDERVRSYREADPTASYMDEMRLLLRQEKAEERETRQEFSRRFEREMGAGSKNYSLAEAAKRVPRRDPRMAMAYADATDQAGLAQRVGEVMSAAKKAAGMAKIPLFDAVRQILENERDTSRKIAGDWLSREAMIQINNLNLGSSIDQAYPVALRFVMRAHPEVNAMWSSGVVSELALRAIFRQWFRD